MVTPETPRALGARFAIFHLVLNHGKGWDESGREPCTQVVTASVLAHWSRLDFVYRQRVMHCQVERFLGLEDGALVRRCFAGLYPVGPEGDASTTADAIAHPDRYVLKPQREGGGNNLYGIDVKRKLEVGGATDEELRSFILMQRIFPKPQPAIMVNRGRCVAGESISEIGVYGTYLAGDDGKELLNEYAGYLVRTKLEGVDEGGVASGYAVLNSAIVGGYVTP